MDGPLKPLPHLTVLGGHCLGRIKIHNDFIGLKPQLDFPLRLHRVDPKVNSNRATGPDLIEPVEAS